MELNDESPVTVTKKPISFRFLIAVILIGIAAYFAGPHVMTYVMLLQEGAKASGPAIERAIPEGRPSMPSSN